MKNTTKLSQNIKSDEKIKPNTNLIHVPLEFWFCSDPKCSLPPEQICVDYINNKQRG